MPFARSAGATVAQVITLTPPGIDVSLTTGVTTAGSTAITYASSTAIKPGMAISHANVAAGTRIHTVTSATAAVLDRPALTTGSSLTFVFSGDRRSTKISQIGYFCTTGGASAAGIIAQIITDDGGGAATLTFAAPIPVVVGGKMMGGAVESFSPALMGKTNAATTFTVDVLTDAGIHVDSTMNCWVQYDFV